MLPRRAQITCGTFSLDASEFFEIVVYLDSAGLSGVPITTLQAEIGYSHSLTIAALRKYFHEHGIERDLLETLSTARDRDASDIHDKVLGVLGLCQVDNRWAFSLGHHLSPQELYLRVAEQVLRASDPFRLFAACFRSSEVDHRVQGPIPSWVPDWSQRIALEPCTDEFEQKSSYRAGGCDLPPITMLGPAGGAEALKVPGKIISTLNAFVERHSDPLRQAFKKAHQPER